MLKKSMPPPYFPQMSDDGIITDDDLTDDIIYAEIRPYAHAETGDAIFFYLDGLLHQFSEVTDTTTWPIIYKIPGGDVPDGVYPCYYKVRDKADNVSVSATQYCIIFRGVDSILPPPVFSDAVGGVITAQNILAVAGTHVAVPAYPGIAVDDVVTLTTLVNGASDFPPESQYTAQHTVTSDDLSGGFSLLVPERVLIVTASGTAYARYTVHSATRNALSEPASASIENSTDTLLPAPWLPDAPADVLTGADVIAHSGVRAALSYPDMRAGDVVVVSLRGLAISGVPVTDTENQVCVVSAAQVAVSEAEVLFSQQIPAKIRDGFLDCYYHVARDGITRLSMIDHVQLVSDIDDTLPAPVFLSAEGGVLYTDTVQAENGTPLLIAYDAMMTGDYVRVLLRGWDAAGQVVPEAEYVTSHTITAPEAAVHQYTEFLPAAPLLAVGDNGKLLADYVVYNNGLGTLSRSFTGETVMKQRESSDLQMVLTMDAPPTDEALASYKAYNRGYLTGAPGMTVQIDCGSNVIIDESGLNRYTLNLNESGHGSFLLYSAVPGSSPVIAFSVNNPALQVNRDAVFSDYTRGEADILVFASTTGAPAASGIPCSVYVVTTPSPEIKKVRVTIEQGEAEILGYQGQTSADIMLSPDHSAEINFISSTTGVVKVLVTLPESSASNELITMAFI
ncbi:hypothetical protein JD793_005113 [Citrobacter braakii]|nr:hypothetical protein [Citrobacter braakii]